MISRLTSRRIAPLQSIRQYTSFQFKNLPKTACQNFAQVDMPPPPPAECEGQCVNYNVTLNALLLGRHMEALKV